MAIHCGGVEFQETGQMGEETDDRTGQPAMLPSGKHINRVSLRATRGVGCGSRSGHLICPAVLVLMTMTNVRTPRVGGPGCGPPGT